MTKSRHTKGPWSYNEESPTRVTAPEGDTVAATYGGMVGIEEQASNTRLIALAPTMYEYIVGKASEGDQEAQAIVSAIEDAGS